MSVVSCSPTTTIIQTQPEPSTTTLKSPPTTLPPLMSSDHDNRSLPHPPEIVSPHDVVSSSSTTSSNKPISPNSTTTTISPSSLSAKLFSSTVLTEPPLFQDKTLPTPHDIFRIAKSYELRDEYDKALPLFHQAANDGHVASMVSYALLLVAIDERAAFEWLRTAANRGHARAWYYLGQLFARGGVFEIAPVDAAKCWFRAAQLGDSGGRSAIGLCYVRGFGVVRDVVKGVSIVKQVALLNDDVNAMKNLAWIYRHGKGVEKNIEEAEYWSNRAMKRDEIIKEANENWNQWQINPV